MLPQIPELPDLLLRAVVIIPALTFHEYAHGWAAYRAGDDTAYRMGRLTLNPLAHLDPIGTIMLFLGPIGWAKPVPVNPANLRRWPKDDILVSVAGVTVNAIQAVVWAILLAVFYRLINRFGGTANEQQMNFLIIFKNIAWWGVRLNVALAVFNLIPIPPLDGSHVLGHMLKGEAAERYRQLYRYGPMLLIIFVAFNLVVPVLSWLIAYVSIPFFMLSDIVERALFFI